jgi:hypothetical protein
LGRGKKVDEATGERHRLGRLVCTKVYAPHIYTHRKSPTAFLTLQTIKNENVSGDKPCKDQKKVETFVNPGSLVFISFSLEGIQSPYPGIDRGSSTIPTGRDELS